MIPRAAAVFAVALAALVTPVAAQGPSASPNSNPSATPPSSPQGVIAKMTSRNPSLGSYTARVHVDLQMKNFPFLSPKLDGTSYFKKPNHNEVVFDSVPSYAKGFEKLFNDVADPLAWEADWNITDKGLAKVDQYPSPLIELYMTKKIYSDQTANAIAYVDPANYQLIQMEWNYRNGGKIVMRQWYSQQGDYSLVSTQQVDINIPHVRAVGVSKFGAYQTNVAVDDSVFKK